jgi:hypothetical protein
MKTKHRKGSWLGQQQNNELMETYWPLGTRTSKNSKGVCASYFKISLIRCNCHILRIKLLCMCKIS